MSNMFLDPLFLTTLLAWLAGGIGMGFAYFRMLRENTALLVTGRRLRLAVSLTVGRLALMAGGLILAGRQGALPLLAMALGVWIGRSIVMRRQAGRAS
ncbi:MULTISPECIES: N-ATPase subunit AtpR [unclassified Rhizobium]|uniref:N-ATPase subunit AtpR n=1 Tax=unclassified Rhizobium TaxID=2613769 RepID=UPI001ADA3107|nr:MULTISPECIES: ATP synthase subunit I [unclassified Rhizobium]MBO9099613.1 ATP synthase subunit I [Rhizobium sp. L58/93]QXZ86916.1 ATP synthase subunit I [Rhizobium sp. K1/93]QXZ93050.1 ATP synthase subunit I [Rhizobium sp. K15/93]